GEWRRILFQMIFATDSSSFTVSQSPPEQTAFAGERINLHCQYSGFCGQNFSVSWYRQSPGEGLKYLLQTCKPSYGHKADFAQSRFSVELQTSRKSSKLTISALELSDSAVYYCAVSPTVIENSNSLVQ
uniref:Ig-like domain-containing protein n=1 Tax=Callorhinchus milii TaxID=7868 RepID=A0A4W3ICX3_CALMI